VIVVKFERKFPASLISHVDLINVINRTLRRAGFDVAYSEGFNPHMLLFFSPPLPVGCESGCEYVTAQIINYKYARCTITDKVTSADKSVFANKAKQVDRWFLRFYSACP